MAAPDHIAEAARKFLELVRTDLGHKGPGDEDATARRIRIMAAAFGVIAAEGHDCKSTALEGEEAAIIFLALCAVQTRACCSVHIMETVTVYANRLLARSISYGEDYRAGRLGVLEFTDDLATTAVAGQA